jgi:hypothetical protein
MTPPISTFQGTYSSKSLANAVANHLAKTSAEAEVIVRKAVRLWLDDDCTKSGTFLIDDDPCPLILNGYLDQMAASIIDGLTEDDRKIIIASSKWSC